jgi:hypothetical protein
VEVRICGGARKEACAATVGEVGGVQRGRGVMVTWGRKCLGRVVNPVKASKTSGKWWTEKSLLV